MIFFIVLIVCIFIILLPIPIKIKIHYSNNDYYVKLYWINIYSKNGGLINKILAHKNTSSNSNTNSKKSYRKKVHNNRNSKCFSLGKLYNSLQNNKYKPYIRFKLLGCYSLNDAALTAILYGCFNNFNFLLLKLFSDFFNVKRFNFSFEPRFKNDIMINLTINSIITFNIAQIIYILFLIRKKEVPLKL